MKKILLLMGLLLAGHCMNAQDLLVIEGDSLNCKITKEDRTYVYFTFRHKSEVRNTLIEKYKVTAMQRGFYAQADFEGVAIPSTHSTYHPWRMALSVGGGYRIAAAAGGMDNSAKSYIDGLRLGLVVGADVDYYFTDYLGAGGKILYNRASNSGYVVGSGDLEDNITTIFIGPVFATRFLSASRKNAFTINLALGYLGYIDKGRVGSFAATMTANTVGIVMDYGYDIGLSKSVSLGFQLSLLAGGFSKANFGGQSITLPGRENLSRIDLTVGIRFHPGKK